MTGALFAVADPETGELKGISGSFTPAEGITIDLTGTLLQDGAVSLVGQLIGSSVAVRGLLRPESYNPDYKSGTLIIGVRRYHVNSKTLSDRKGLPYRFIWCRAGSGTRVAC
jgi:hypothetical protein